MLSAISISSSVAPDVPYFHSSPRTLPSSLDAVGCLLCAASSLVSLPCTNGIGIVMSCSSVSLRRSRLLRSIINLPNTMTARGVLAVAHDLRWLDVGAAVWTLPGGDRGSEPVCGRVQHRNLGLVLFLGHEHALRAHDGRRLVRIERHARPARHAGLRDVAHLGHLDAGLAQFVLDADEEAALAHDFFFLIRTRQTRRPRSSR